MTTIQGNYIGTDASVMLPIGNLYGASRTNQIGRGTATARNIISANGNFGIQLFDADRNTIQGNYIGTAGMAAPPRVTAAAVFISIAAKMSRSAAPRLPSAT